MKFLPLAVALLVLGQLVPTTLHAYMGPTLGLGVIGAIVVAVIVFLLSIFSFVVIPIRKMLRNAKKGQEDKKSDDSER